MAYYTRCYTVNKKKDLNWHGSKAWLDSARIDTSWWRNQTDLTRSMLQDSGILLDSEGLEFGVDFQIHYHNHLWAW